MNITIIGGGNIGMLMASEMASSGNAVTIFTRYSAEKWSKSIKVYNSSEECLTIGNLDKVTSDLTIAVKSAEIIFITTPSFTFEKLASELYELVREDQIIVIVPGTGGGEFAFSRIIEKGCTFCGLQRVHSIARIKKRGESVYSLGKKDNLSIGTIPRERSEYMVKIMKDLFKLPVQDVTPYINITMTPSNPILHTARIFSMLRGCTRDFKFDREMLFYKEWTVESSEVLLRCDREWEMICDALPFELSGVKSLKTHYESYTKETMTDKISNIKAFKDIKMPMEKVGDSWIVDINSRYFTADFSFGLKVLIDIAELFDTNVEYLNEIWKWYLQYSGEKDFFKINMTKEDFVQFYLR